MSDQYETRAVEAAIEAKCWDEFEERRIPMKIEWAVNMLDSLNAIEPGRQPKGATIVRSVQASIRAADRKIFVVIKATLHFGTKNESKVVGFHSAKELSTALYEAGVRFQLGTIKWREDTPWAADDPNDAPEPLPKWDDPEA